MEWVFTWVAHYGYAVIFILLVLGIVGLPIPDEPMLAFAGYLVSSHRLDLLPTILVAFLGSACGISVSYGLGRRLGTNLVEILRRFLRIHPQHLDAVQAWYARRGKYTLLVGYFLPGFRHLTAFVAGWGGLSFSVFALFAYTGGLLWSMSFITLGFFLGEGWIQTSATVHRLLVVGSATAMLALIVSFRLVRRKRR